jgi:hypothetical protein
VFSALALVVFFLLKADRSKKPFRLSLLLLTIALLANTYVSFKLHPDTVQVKQQVASFEQESPDSAEKKEFRRLHAISAVMNLFMLVDGIALLALSRGLIKKKRAWLYQAQKKASDDQTGTIGRQ